MNRLRTTMLTCCQDHILKENIWFVWSLTSYSGDERRCDGCGTTNERTNIEDRATQPMEAGGWVSQFSMKLTQILAEKLRRSQIDQINICTLVSSEIWIVMNVAIQRKPSFWQKCFNIVRNRMIQQMSFYFVHFYFFFQNYRQIKELCTVGMYSSISSWIERRNSFISVRYIAEF